MESKSSSYVMEIAHQRRMMMLLAALLLVFSAGVRFDRAFFIEGPKAKDPSSAFASLVPPPAVFAGEARVGSPTQGTRAIGRPRVPGAPDAVAEELAPTGPVDGSPLGAEPGVPPGPAALAAATPNGQFGNGDRSLFGIPSGVIFGNPGGATPETPGGVPEPETWMLMILGVGMIGMMLRNRGARCYVEGAR